MNRLVDAELILWKNKKLRKPLLLRGARQVGKTWVARKLAQSFTSFVEVNLEAQPELHPLFDKFFGAPDKLIEQLNLILDVKIEPKKTLLFIDEIQENKKALLSLRYFYEKLPELHVIAAGSLIEFALKEISFPVGRIEFKHLFPFNFHEYLLAINRSDLIQVIAEFPRTEISETLHETLLSEIKTYFFVGGMPEVIQTYFDSKDLKLCAEKQALLINNYRADFNKYASRSQVQHLRLIFDSIPRLFSKKFVYSQIANDIKSRELGTALNLLCDAGLVYKCYHTSANGSPLSAEIDSRKFKVYFVDIGLSLKSLGIAAKDFPKINFDSLINKGGLAEQFVCQELISHTAKNEAPQTYYWQREALNSSAEVDFVTAVADLVIPIEVKSGLGRASKSLSIFTHEKKSQFALKVSASPFHLGSNKSKLKIVSLPFYGLINDLQKLIT